MVASLRWNCGLKSDQGLLFLHVSCFQTTTWFFTLCMWFGKNKTVNKTNKVTANTDYEKYRLEQGAIFLHRIYHIYKWLEKENRFQFLGCHTCSLTLQYSFMSGKERWVGSMLQPNLTYALSHGTVIHHACKVGTKRLDLLLSQNTVSQIKCKSVLRLGCCCHLGWHYFIWTEDTME